MEKIIKQDFFLSSPTGERLHCIVWSPPQEAIRGVIQLVHGMIEYIDCYDATARFFCANGFAVIGHDHPGHGATVQKDADLGYIPFRGGSDALVENVAAVTRHIRNQYGSLPLFIMGHSMGSFITRKYLAKYGEGLDGAIIMGTGAPGRATVLAAKALSWLVALTCGDRHRSRLITKLAFGSYNKHYPQDGPNGWICSDRAYMKKHDADPLATFVFTAGAYRVLFDTLWFLARGRDIAGIPRRLPLLVTVGEEDPVGAYGEGPRLFAQRCQNAGVEDVTLQMYPGDRHEILNEPDQKTVRINLLEWLIRHMPK